MRPVDITIGLTPADANGICAAQTVAAAGELSPNGALAATTGIARLGTAAQITIVCAADESDRIFTITGKNASGQVTVEKLAGVDTATATSTYSYREVSRVESDGANSGNVEVGVSSDDNAIATAATLTQTAAYALDGVLTYEATMYGVAEFDAALAVLIYSAGDDSADIFTVYGQDTNRVDISEAIAGANAGTATTTKLFKKVYAIYTDGASAGAVYAGWAGATNGIAKSQTVTAAGYLAMNGAYCSLQSRHVSITSASADESGDTFTVVGLNRRGDRITEEIAGPGALATVKGDKNFSIVQAIYVNGALSGDVTVGSADECESRPIVLDYRISGLSAAIHHSTGSGLTHRFLSTQDNLLSSMRNEDTARWDEVKPANPAGENFSTTTNVMSVRLEITGHVFGIVDLLLTFPVASS